MLKMCKCCTMAFHSCINFFDTLKRKLLHVCEMLLKFWLLFTVVICFIPFIVPFFVIYVWLFRPSFLLIWFLSHAYYKYFFYISVLGEIYLYGFNSTVFGTILNLFVYYAMYNFFMFLKSSTDTQSNQIKKNWDIDEIPVHPVISLKDSSFQISTAAAAASMKLR